MISYTVYKVVHFAGIFTLFVSLAVGLTRAASLAGVHRDPWARRLLLVQVVALFFVILGGFGLMSRLGISHVQVFPGWIWTKLAIWTTVASLTLVARRWSSWSVPALFLLPVLGAAAAFVALTKPFL